MLNIVQKKNLKKLFLLNLMEIFIEKIVINLVLHVIQHSSLLKMKKIMIKGSRRTKTKVFRFALKKPVFLIKFNIERKLYDKC